MYLSINKFSVRDIKCAESMQHHYNRNIAQSPNDTSNSSKTI